MLFADNWWSQDFISVLNRIRSHTVNIKEVKYFTLLGKIFILETGDSAKLIVCLLAWMKPWVLFPTLHKSSVIAHACNHKLKAMPSCIGILGPNLDYMRSCLKIFHFKMIECTEYGNIGSLTIETSYPLALDHLQTKSSSRTTQVYHHSSAHPAAGDPSSRSFYIHSLKQHSSLVPHHR